MAKILVIDDNADLLETIRQVLEMRGGHQAVLSADGMDGLRKALADPPELVIVDVMMPDVSGYEICRQLRANPATASIPIIIFTARGQLVDRQAALDAGANDYMVKPVPMKELLERINGLLAERVAEKKVVLARTVVLLSLRGGVGVTTLAVNLAATLARAGDHSPLVEEAEVGGAACLVDLCSSSGHVALQLGLRPEPNWSDLVGISAPDAEALDDYLLSHTSGLRVLASPVLPVLGQELPGAVVQAMLGTLQQRFAVTVVDASSVLNEVTMAALEVATVVGLVITAEAPSIQTAVGTLRALRQWSDRFHRVPIRIILNQTAPGPSLPAEAIERTLRRPLVGTIPFDPAQARALTQRAPLALHNPDSPLAQAVQGLAQTLVRVTSG